MAIVRAWGEGNGVRGWQCVFGFVLLIMVGCTRLSRVFKREWRQESHRLSDLALVLVAGTTQTFTSVSKSSASWIFTPYKPNSLSGPTSLIILGSTMYLSFCNTCTISSGPTEP